MAGLAGDDLCRGHTFFFRFVREHRAGDGVADRVDAGGGSAQMRIDNDAAAIILLHADRFEAKSFSERHTANRHQNDVGFHRLGRAAARCRFDFDLQRLAGVVDRSDFRRKLERHALLLQQAMKLARDLAIDARQDVIEELDDRYLRRRAAATPSPAQDR